MEMIKSPLSNTLEQNEAELRAFDSSRKPESRTYSPNGAREVARRLRQMERIRSKAEA